MSMVGLIYWTGSYCTNGCPTNVPFLDKDKNVCRTCVDANPLKPFWDGSDCVSCADDEFFDGEKCVPECPNDKPFADEHNICWACVDYNPDEPLWNG